MHIPLEDGFQDVIGKARRGLRFTEPAVAEKAGINLEQLEALGGGKFDAETARPVALALGLDAAALIALGDGSWYPEAPAGPATFAMFNTVYEDMRVNAYLVWDQDGGRAVAFDTGGDCAGMLETLRAHRLTLDTIFITHAHPDHVAALGELRKATGAAVLAPANEGAPKAASVEDGARFDVAGVTVTARETPGHSPGGTTYVVEGLATPLAMVGDAMFAGSMGGVPPEKYAAALLVNREKILSLPGETIICPGHGPLTTVSQEKMQNPFYAGSR